MHVIYLIFVRIAIIFEPQPQKFLQNTQSYSVHMKRDVEISYHRWIISSTKGKFQNLQQI